MRVAVLFALLALIACAFAAEELAIDADIIKAINSDPKSSWVAGSNKIFEGKTLSQIKHFFGAYLLDQDTPINKVKYEAAAVPDSFNSETQWPNCKHPVRDQQHCGSCWAFSGSEVLSDRFCIATQGKTNVVLSPQDMVSCDTGDYGCQGGILTNLWQYLEQTGIVSDSCMPYTSGSGAASPCPTKCADGSSFTKYRVKSGSTQQFEDVQSAQQDIMKNGPIQIGFKVYKDFLSYKSGVYRHTTGGFLGGHAVMVTGWGVDSSSKLPYWIVKNSWGTSWGLDGYFWILRGKNECSLESSMYAGVPNV